MSKYLYLLLISIFFLYGCVDDIVNSEIAEDALIRPIIFLSPTASLSTIKSTEITIKNVKIIKDVLIIEASYPGGCETHSIALFSSSSFQESYPAQLPMKLIQRSFSDTCSQIISEKLYYDLNSVAALYELAYTSNAGIVALSIYDADSTTYFLPQPRYEF